MFCCSRPTQHILVKMFTSERFTIPRFSASPMICSLGPYPHASGPVSNVSTPARTKGAKSSDATEPLVRSVFGSPLCPPLSCQHPLITVDGVTVECFSGVDAGGTEVAAAAKAVGTAMIGDAPELGTATDAATDESKSRR